MASPAKALPPKAPSSKAPTTPQQQGAKKAATPQSNVAGGSSSSQQSSSQTGPTATASGENVKLKYQLAEVIDEVVFAEKDAAKKQEELNQVSKYANLLEETIENLLSYSCQLEQNCLLPAVGDLNSYFRANESLSVASQNRDVSLKLATEMLQKVPNKQRQQLLDILRGPLSNFAMERVNSVRRSAIPPQSKQLLPLEDGVVLVSQYLKGKEELLVLLTDAKQRLQSAAWIHPATDEQIEASDVVVKLRKEVEVLKTERTELLKKSQQATTYEELQTHYYSNQESLQKKVLELEGARREDEKDRFVVAQRFETLQSAMDQAHQERSLLKIELDKARRELTQQKIQLQSSGSDGQREAHSLRIEMDRLIRDHSSLVTQLEGQIAGLRMELAETKSMVNSGAATHQLQQLHHDNDALRKSLATLQSRMSATSLPSGGGSADSVSFAASSPGVGLDSKIKAFESTIGALNGELSQVEGKITSIEQHYKDERTRMVSQFDSERKVYLEEREECDNLVLKMTNELEFLVRENAALKLRARNVQT